MKRNFVMTIALWVAQGFAALVFLLTGCSLCPIQAISPDSTTLHCYGSSGLTMVSLAGLQ